MAGRLIVLMFVHLAMVLTSSKYLESPCPKLFKYDTNNEKDRWYGDITLLSNKTLDGVWLRFLFNSAPLHVEFQNQFGEIHTFDGVNYIVKNVAYELKANTPLMLRFYVQYDTGKPIPLLIGIRLNAETICIAEELDNHSDPIANTASDETTTISRECPLQADSPSHGTFLSTNDSCGRPSLRKPESLILEKNSTDGKWPWIVVIYKNILGVLSYQCGGSLISHNFILTTAFCVAVEFTGEAYIPNKVLAYLGTTSTTYFSDGLQIATISRIVIHPQYTTANYDNNIAILKTKKPIDYTYFVKPVCLWDGDHNISRLYDEIGNVISWKDDQYGKSSKTIKEYRLVIIDNISCGYANPNNFKPFIHNRGFCAGAQRASREFDGDSGSILVVKQGNVNGEKLWYLRGLSSTCPYDTNKRCDPNYYGFFLDVAKYVPWIKENMKNI